MKNLLLLLVSPLFACSYADEGAANGIVIEVNQGLFYDAIAIKTDSESSARQQFHLMPGLGLGAFEAYMKTRRRVTVHYQTEFWRGLLAPYSRDFVESVEAE